RLDEGGVGVGADRSRRPRVPQRVTRPAARDEQLLALDLVARRLRVADGVAAGAETGRGDGPEQTDRDRPAASRRGAGGRVLHAGASLSRGGRGGGAELRQLLAGDVRARVVRGRVPESL